MVLLLEQAKSQHPRTSATTTLLSPTSRMQLTRQGIKSHSLNLVLISFSSGQESLNDILAALQRKSPAGAAPAKAAAAPAASASSASNPKIGMPFESKVYSTNHINLAPIYAGLEAQLKARGAELVQQVKGIYLFEVKGQSEDAFSSLNLLQVTPVRRGSLT